MHVEAYKTERGYTIDIYSRRGLRTYRFESKKEFDTWLKALRRRCRYENA